MPSLDPVIIRSDRKLDVVFVHGLDDNAIDAWQQRNDPKTFWPRWLAEQIDVQIWMLNYDAPKFWFQSETMPLPDRAKNVLDYLINHQLGQRDLLFITHSLGGLVVKLLLQISTDTNGRLKTLASATRGIVFLATPHTGSNIATVARRLGIASKVTAGLQTDDPWLRLLNDWYRNKVQQFGWETRAFCETLPMGQSLVVSNSSADPQVEGVLTIPIKANHVDICKPKSKSAEVYKAVEALITQCLNTKATAPHPIPLEATGTSAYVESHRDSTPIPLTLKARLQDLHDKQLRMVRRLGLSFRSERPRGLSDIATLGSESIRGVIPSFKYNEIDTGSWIRSHSLPIQLLTQSHLTVDLTIDELKKDRPFGIPFQSLFNLTDAGFLYLNLRDYDSDKDNDFTGYCEERVATRIDRLLNEIPGKIYIGSALRKAVFDAALQHSGYDRPYEEFYTQARADLVAAYHCYEQFPYEDEVVRRSLFRGERPSLTAVCWHWAFLISVSHYLPADIIRIGDNTSRLQSLYAKAVEYGDSAKANRSDKMVEIAAGAFAELATQLRICHLNFTAPMTASYGTTYNMTEDEYRESVRLGVYWEEQASLMHDDELERFLFYVLSDVENFQHSSALLRN